MLPETLPKRATDVAESLALKFSLEEILRWVLVAAILVIGLGAN